MTELAILAARAARLRAKRAGFYDLLTRDRDDDDDDGGNAGPEAFLLNRVRRQMLRQRGTPAADFWTHFDRTYGGA